MTIVIVTSQLRKMEQGYVRLRMRTENSWPKDSRSGNQIGAAACVPQARYAIIEVIEVRKGQTEMFSGGTSVLRE